MTEQQLDNLIGRQMRDLYGRYVGVIAGISTDSSGKIQAMGIDTGYDGFKNIAGNLIIFQDESPMLVSKWWQDTNNFLKNSGLAEKKIRALEELYNEGEITKEVYEQLADKHKAQFDLKSTNRDNIIGSLNDKVAALNNENYEVQGFLGNMKLQHRIGEIDDATYQASSEYINSILQRNEKEVVDITASLNDLTPTEPKTIVEEDNATEQASPEVVEEPVSEVAEEQLTYEEPIQAEETVTDENIHAEESIISQSVMPMTDVDTTDADIPQNENSEGMPAAEELASSDTVETPSLTEEISTDLSSPDVEENTMNPQMASDNIDEDIDSSTDVVKERFDDNASEVTEVSENMLIEENVASSDTVTNSDTDEDSEDDVEITDTVTFEDDSTDNIGSSSSVDYSETPNNTEDSEEDNIVYTTQ